MSPTGGQTENTPGKGPEPRITKPFFSPEVLGLDAVDIDAIEPNGEIFTAFKYLM